MRNDKIDPNRNPTEVRPKDTKTELTDEELAKVSGGNLNTGQHFPVAIIHCR